MKVILIFLISFSFIGTSLVSIAQSNDTIENLRNSTFKNDVTQKQIASVPDQNSKNQKSQQKDVKNQIYISNEWQLGTIVLWDGGLIDNYYLRYNLLTDQLQFVAGNDTLTFSDPEALNTVSFGGHVFIYEKYQSYDSIRQGYFELIVPGKNKLMLKRSVINRKPGTIYSPDETQKKYQVDECYFISKPGMPANKLACNRKSALTYLNDHNEDIAEYLRITGNKVRTIEDLKLLVSYYNSLDEEY